MLSDRLLLGHAGQRVPNASRRTGLNSTAASYDLLLHHGRCALCVSSAPT